jgi:hypothetical protein
MIIDEIDITVRRIHAQGSSKVHGSHQSFSIANDDRNGRGFLSENRATEFA